MGKFKFGIISFFLLCLPLVRAFALEPVWAQFKNNKECQALLIGKQTFIVNLNCIESYEKSQKIVLNQQIFEIHPRSFVFGNNFVTFKVVPESLYKMVPGDLVPYALNDTASLAKVFKAQIKSTPLLEITSYIENAKERELSQDEDISVQLPVHELKTRERILEEARQHIGLISSEVYDGLDYLNWDWMRSMLYYTTQKEGVQKGEMRTMSSHRSHPRPIWHNKEGETKYTDWCGIFATYVLRKAGFDVYWGLGTMRGNIVITRRYEKTFDPKSFAKGDVLIGKGPSWHHVIIVDTLFDKKGHITGFRTIEGNSPGIKEGHMKLDFVTAHIKMLP